jgi:hypothetical protein
MRRGANGKPEGRKANEQNKERNKESSGGELTGDGEKFSALFFFLLVICLRAKFGSWGRKGLRESFPVLAARQS